MDIIPVIDIKEGQAVHAVKGERNRYLPVETVLSETSDVISIASTLKENYGFSELYIADLDSIESGKENYSIISELIKETGLDIYLDCGIKNINDLSKQVLNSVYRIILGTESLNKKEVVEEAIKMFGEEKLVISIDLKNDKPLGTFSQMEPFELVKIFYETGIRTFIILDLKYVGSNLGISEYIISLLDKCEEYDGISFITGGGIKGQGDIDNALKTGISKLLVGTALHNNSITRENIINFRKNNKS